MMSFEIETALLLVLACALGVALGLFLRRRAEQRRRISLFAQTTFLPLDESGPGIDAAILRGDATEQPPIRDHKPSPPAGAAAPSPIAPEGIASRPVDPPEPAATPPANPAASKARRRGSASQLTLGIPDVGSPETVDAGDRPSPPASPSGPAAGEANLPGQRPPAVAQPDAAGADDLKQIKGIGPLNERKLNALGIYHFRQIAAWTQDEARWIGAFLGFRGRVEREDWIGQARVRSTSVPPDEMA
jgi:NADH-quinone oxidoreductase subunit E